MCLNGNEIVELLKQSYVIEVILSKRLHKAYLYSNGKIYERKNYTFVPGVEAFYETSWTFRDIKSMVYEWHIQKNKINVLKEVTKDTYFGKMRMLEYVK